MGWIRSNGATGIGDRGALVINRTSMVPYRVRVPARRGASESLLSAWLGLPSLALGFYVLAILAAANLGRPGVGGSLIEAEHFTTILSGPNGSGAATTLVKNFVLSPDGWLLIAVGAILGFAGSARRRGVSRFSLIGLFVNLLAFLVSWLLSFGLILHSRPGAAALAIPVAPAPALSPAPGPIVVPEAEGDEVSPPPAPRPRPKNRGETKLFRHIHR